jgi:diguanylate cyclase (GGDEF)-like protein/PAS domain S-box-containing protein
MFIDRIRSLGIGTKLQALLGLGFFLGIALLLGYQTLERVKNTEAERRDANVRIVRVLSGPVGGALASHDSNSVIYSFMEVLAQQPTAAGLVIVEAGKVVKTQQSIDHMELPTERLASVALEAANAVEDRIVSDGEYQLVAVPIVDSASRPVGSFAIGWSTKGLLDAVWRDALVQAGVLLLIGLVLLGALASSIRRMVSEPISTIAATLEGAMTQANGAEKLAKYEARQDEMGSLARAAAIFQERTLELRNLNTRFDAALTNMSQGLVMFDAQQRLLVCNRSYKEIYGLPSDAAKPGSTIKELFDQFVSLGQFSPEEAARAFEARQRLIRDGKPGTSLRELGDGRFVEIVHQPMGGGGWVATHHDITDRRMAEAQIAHMAHHDALTGLANRVAFRNHMQGALARVERGEAVAVLCLDLDRFKAVNDTLGHPAGDELLRAVAQRLKDCMREGDVLARLGGDEFAIVQVGVQEPKGVTALAERIIADLTAPYDINGYHVVIGTSIGIALAPADGDSPDQLLRNADMALYKAKGEGRGTYRFFEAEMDARMQARRALETDLRKALASAQFEVFYQPIVDVLTKEVAGFEALLRWHHPERGMVSPMEFIPLAEDIGVLGPIGAWVLKQACAEAAKWPKDISIAVNLSPCQFKSRALVLDVASALGTSGLAPHRLELEITESVLLQDTDATLSVLDELRGLGVRIAMDDFGTGYSSLSYLRKFQFDKIKIDQSFVRDLTDNPDSVAIIRAISALGTSLGMTTTAEGVETGAQLRMLEAEGCNEVQGFLFSKPRPAAEAVMLINSISRDARNAA